MKFAICGNYGVGNIGDEAILAGLKIALKKTDPLCEIEVIGHGLHMPFGLRSLMKGFREPYNAIKRCDVYVLGGGGLFTNEEGFFVPLFWAYQGFSALMLKKKLLCLGISVGKVGYFDRLILKWLFSKALLVTVRDKGSFELLTSLGINVHETSDFSLFLQRPILNEEKSEKPYVVISIRPFKNGDKKLYTIIAQLCDTLIADYGLFIKLLPFQNGMEIDATTLNKIFDQIDRKDSVAINPFVSDLTQLTQLLADAKLVIAMRLHAGILSMLSGTPFIPLVYMQKVRNFWLNCKQIRTIDINQITLEQLMSVFSELWNNRRDHRALIETIRDRLTQDAATNIDLIKDALQREGIGIQK